MRFEHLIAFPADVKTGSNGFELEIVVKQKLLIQKLVRFVLSEIL